MRVDLRDSAAPGISAPLAGAGVAVTIGVAEFARVALREGLGSGDLQRGLLLVVPVYAAVGLLAGLACWMARRVSAAPAAAFAALVVIAVAGSEPRPIVQIAGLALGALLLQLGAVALARFSSLPRARLASTTALLAIAGVCTVAADALPAYGPRWALGAAVAAGAGVVLVWTPKVRGSALLLGGAALALVWQGAQHVQRLAPTAKPAANAPSVLLVTIDTLRADRVGAYGYSGARTPTLDTLARQGVQFENAYAHSMFTGPSHATILTGRTPLSTGFLINHQGLDPKAETLAEALASAGYVTAAFPSAYTTIERSTRLPSHFQYADGDLREHNAFPEGVYHCVLIRALAPLLKAHSTWPTYRPAAATTDRAIRFLDAHSAAPTFTWVHYFDPHAPYAPPEELRRGDSGLVHGDWYRLSARERRELIADPAKLNAMRGLYDAEIAYVDRELARLFAAAREDAPAGGLLIVVTADHGEPMGEHGHYWKRDLYEPTLRVPLLMLPPPSVPNAPRRVREIVRLIDVAPTILDWLGLPNLARAEGHSLRALASGSAAEAPGPAVAVFEPETDGFGAPSASVRREGWKLIRHEAGMWAPDEWKPAREELYDLSTDPGETTNRAAESAPVVQELAPLLPFGWKPATPSEVTPEERERLRALGYLL
jgi:arylsulfatase A-like enzyme